MDWMASNLDLLGFDESPKRVESAHEFAQRAPTHRGILETSEPGVDSRNSEIAGASSGDGARGGSVSAPEVYLMGHSSGSHISLLYLIRREEERRRGASTRSGDSMEKELEVEGLIGLSGVYDVHRHYLFESWRLETDHFLLCTLAPPPVSPWRIVLRHKPTGERAATVYPR